MKKAVGSEIGELMEQAARVEQRRLDSVRFAEIFGAKDEEWRRWTRGHWKNAWHR